jgi:hypothetical protein
VPHDVQLVAIVRKQLVEASLYQIQQVLSLTQFEKTPILWELQEKSVDNDLDDLGKQLILFDF